jgi:hypothetical protein
MVLGARVVGAAAVIVAVALITAAEGRWSPLHPRQAVLALTLATILVQLGLGLRFGVVGAGPVADLVGVSLALSAALGELSNGSLPGCAQLLIPYQAAWAFFLLGAGSAVVAGSSGVLLIIGDTEWLGRRLKSPGGPALRALMAQATSLTLVALGIGLVVSVWWAWRSLGASQWDPRQGGVAIVWLLAAMSLLTRHLRGNRERWAEVLIALAATAAVLGLMVLR